MNMASTTGLLSLANELILTIVHKLNDRKLQEFDPVAVPDLQSTSSVNKRLRGITLPVLFEYMVFDTKFLEDEDMMRYVRFHAS